MNLTIIFADYFYSKYYCGCSAASADTKGEAIAHTTRHNHRRKGLAQFRSLDFGEAQRVPQGRRTHRCSAEEHGAPDLLMQSRQLLGRDAARRGMAAVAGGCLIKLYELANLSSCKGKTSHRRSPERLLSDKACSEKTRRKESTYSSIPMKASQTVTKPTTYDTLQCATSFSRTNPF